MYVVSICSFLFPRFWKYAKFLTIINGLADESKLLLVTILAARFCSFWRVCSLVTPQLPHTEQQYRKWGSTIPLYILLTVFRGKNFLEYFRNAIPRETLVRILLICSDHRFLSIITPRYFVWSTFSTWASPMTNCGGATTFSVIFLILGFLQKLKTLNVMSHRAPASVLFYFWSISMTFLFRLRKVKWQCTQMILVFTTLLEIWEISIKR